MNDIKIFEHEKFGKIRVMVDKDKKEWFIAKEITDILKYQNGSRDIKRHVDTEDYSEMVLFDGVQNRKQLVINESGLYSLIFGSKMKEAKKFKKWVTSEVLPMIRKTGMYIADNIWAQIASSPEKIGTY